MNTSYQFSSEHNVEGKINFSKEAHTFNLAILIFLRNIIRNPLEEMQ